MLLTICYKKQTHSSPDSPLNKDASCTCKKNLNFIINALIFLVSKLKSLTCLNESSITLRKSKALLAYYVFIYFPWNIAFLFKFPKNQQLCKMYEILVRATPLTIHHLQCTFIDLTIEKKRRRKDHVKFISLSHTSELYALVVGLLVNYTNCQLVELITK